MSKSYLVIDRGLAGERVFHLQSRLTIGRAPESDIHLPDPSVSRQHAEVYLSEGKPIVEDLESSNGTFVNDEEVKKAFLKSGDTLRVGSGPLLVLDLLRYHHQVRKTERKTLMSSEPMVDETMTI